MALWVIRILFLILCTTGGYAISQVREEVVGLPYSAPIGMIVGFGFGWLMIAIDEMLKGFSLRAFSATTFGLLLGTVVALLIDHSGLFDKTDEVVRWPARGEALTAALRSAADRLRDRAAERGPGTRTALLTRAVLLSALGVHTSAESEAGRPPRPRRVRTPGVTGVRPAGGRRVSHPVLRGPGQGALP